MFILLFISFSDLPSSIIREPRYVNVWTFSVSFPSMCILVLGGLLLLENTIVFVFFAFIRSPREKTIFLEIKIGLYLSGTPVEPDLDYSHCRHQTKSAG